MKYDKQSIYNMVEREDAYIALVIGGIIVGVGFLLGWIFHLEGVQNHIDRNQIDSNYITYTDDHTLILTNIAHPDTTQNLLFWRTVDMYKAYGWQFNGTDTIYTPGNGDKLQVILVR